MRRVHALNCDGCVLTASPCVSASLLPSHRAMVGLSRDCVSLVLSLLGVAGALPLVLTTRAIASPQDLRSVRAAYIAAARTFGMPWQIRALVRAAGASSFLPVAYLRLCYAVFLVVRLCFRPLRAPGVCLAYPLFGEVAPGCLQLAGPRSRESAFALVFAALGFLPPSHEDRHNLDGDLLLGGLPADPRVAWLRLNRGPWQASLRRIVALLRLGNSTLHFYHRAPELDRPPAFVLQRPRRFRVLRCPGARWRHRHFFAPLMDTDFQWYRCFLQVVCTHTRPYMRFIQTCRHNVDATASHARTKSACG